MAIIYDEKAKCITLHTKNSSYQMKIGNLDYLIHLYYGPRMPDSDLSWQIRQYDRGFSGNPYRSRHERTFSLDAQPQEFPTQQQGDFRIGSIDVMNADGSRCFNGLVKDVSISEGKYRLLTLPASFASDKDTVHSLRITLEDEYSHVQAILQYGVFEQADIITRSVTVKNGGRQPIHLHKIMSVCLDFLNGSDMDIVNFPGRYGQERQVERQPLTHHVHKIRSGRGISSHQQNPFVALTDRTVTEESGSCYGFSLMYSGSFLAEVELDQYDQVRLVMGINDRLFSYAVEAGEDFDTPAVLMTYTDSGLTGMSHIYHDFFRNNLNRSRFVKDVKRPVLLNTWEAAFFDFDDVKLVEIARAAKKMGVEMIVMDDGWFGKRDDDNSGLGDWYVNEDKIKCGLKSLVEQVNAKGLKFGIWMEPEMVNEDSDLYRAHPDWAFAMPGRTPARARNQLVLDLSRQEVVDYLYGCIAKVLSENNIEYLKWDMNRSLSDVYSAVLPASRQGEVLHRFMLGLYGLMERVTKDFPDVLIEGCSGGGARFDAGILCYSPQIWCSDDTDPIHRLSIQYGTSFGYPVSTVGAHVSASPNHQTGRTTPFNTRGVTAMAGTFGYELDPAKLSLEEKNMIREQLGIFREHYDLIQDGFYYRLTGLGEEPYMAWEFASEDRNEALLSVVVKDIQPNQTLINIRLKGLDPDGLYKLTEESKKYMVHNMMYPDIEARREYYKGDALMNAGYTFPMVFGDYPAMQLHFSRVD